PYHTIAILAIGSAAIWRFAAAPKLPVTASSTADGSLGLDIERVDRLARRHEEPVALDPAEAQIGATFGQHDAADHLAVGGEDHNSVLGLAAGPGAPQ